MLYPITESGSHTPEQVSKAIAESIRMFSEKHSFEHLRLLR